MTKKDYMGILLEEIRDNVKLLAEGQTAMREDISTLKSDVSTLKSDVSTLKSDMSKIKQELTEFKKDTKEKFDLIITYLMRIEDEISEIKREIAGIKDGSIPVDNVTDLEERVAFLETEVAELKTTNN